MVIMNIEKIIQMSRYNILKMMLNKCASYWLHWKLTTWTNSSLSLFVLAKVQQNDVNVKINSKLKNNILSTKVNISSLLFDIGIKPSINNSLLYIWNNLSKNVNKLTHYISLYYWLTNIFLSVIGCGWFTIVSL